MDETPLTGWKDIAAFLGTSVRTVQRFEQELALPVHRTRASKGAVVRAYPSELRTWLDARNHASGVEVVEPTSPAPASVALTRWRLRIAVLATIGVAFVVIAVWVWHTSGAGRSSVSVDPLTQAGRLKPDGAPRNPRPGTVRLTIRLGNGSPLALAVPDGGRGEITVVPGMVLSLEPTIDARDLLLDIGRRSPGQAATPPLARLRVAAGQPAHISIDNEDVEILWNGAGPVSPRP